MSEVCLAGCYLFNQQACAYFSTTQHPFYWCCIETHQRPDGGEYVCPIHTHLAHIKNYQKKVHKVYRSKNRPEQSRFGGVRNHLIRGDNLLFREAEISSHCSRLSRRVSRPPIVYFLYTISKSLKDKVYEKESPNIYTDSRYREYIYKNPFFFHSSYVCVLRMCYISSYSTGFWGFWETFLVRCCNC